MRKTIPIAAVVTLAVAALLIWPRDDTPRGRVAAEPRAGAARSDEPAGLRRAVGPVEPSSAVAERRTVAAETAGSSGVRKTFTLVVHVIDQGGKAAVTELAAPLALRGPHGHSTASLDDAGQARFRSLRAGAYVVSYRGADFRARSNPIKLVGEPRDVHRLLAGTRLMMLRVRMSTPSGEPLKKALRARGADVGTLTAVATRDPQELGRPRDYARDASPFVLSRPFPLATSEEPPWHDHLLDLELEESPPAVFVSAVLGGWVIGTTSAAPTDGDVRFVIALDEIDRLLCSVRVQFVDEDGVGIPDGVVQLKRGTGRVVEARTDGYGATIAAWLRPGSYSLVASFSAGRARVRRSVVLEPGKRLDLGAVVVPYGVTISGVVLGEEREIAGREVGLRLVERRGGEVRLGLETTVRSASNGRFRSSRLEPGRYAVRVRKSKPTSWQDRGSESAFVIVDARAGDVDDVRLRLEALHRVQVHTHYTDDAPVQLQVLDASGLQVRRTEVCAVDCQLYLDLVTGAYTLVAWRGEETPRRPRPIAFEAVPAGVVIDLGP